MTKITLLFSVLGLLISASAFATAAPLKRGDRTIFVSDTVSFMVHVVNVYEDATAKICILDDNQYDYLSSDCRFYRVRMSVLALPVASLNGFSKGDRVCLNKKEKSCGKIVRIYESGHVELLKFDIFGIRSFANAHDVLVNLSDIHHQN